MNKVTWLDAIISAMVRLGGHSVYADLYDIIELMQLRDTSAVKDFKAQVRGTIERFSSDSEVFHKTNSTRDIFYLVGEKGDGHWGLRDFEPSGTNVDLTEDDEGFAEGKERLRLHICRDRNYKVISEAKRQFKENHGKLYCEVCSFDFSAVYGELGEDYIEGHHVIPVSELSVGDRTKVSDIALVCSNCHRMLHRRRPWLKPGELKLVLKSTR